MTSRTNVKLWHPVAHGVWRCAWLGLRDAWSLRVIGAMAMVWLVATLLMACALWSIWIRYGVTPAQAIAPAVLTVALMAGLVGGGGGNMAAGVATGLGTAALMVAMAAVISAVLIWFLLTILVRILTELVLMRAVRSRVLKRYPEFDSRQSRERSLPLSFSNRVRPWLLGIVGIPICLLLPAVGGGAMVLLAGYVNARTLVNDAFGDDASPMEVRRFLDGHRIQLLGLGTLMAGLNFVPMVGLLAPWATGAAVCHMVMGSARARDLETTPAPNQSPSAEGASGADGAA